MLLCKSASPTLTASQNIKSVIFWTVSASFVHFSNVLMGVEAGLKYSQLFYKGFQ